MLKQIFILAATFLLSISFVNSQEAQGEIFRNQADLDASVGFADNLVFDGVGLFTGDDASGGSFLAGSGVFIGNGTNGQNAWILTAGHVMFDEPNLLWESMQFNPSADVGANLDQFIDVDSVFAFPGFTGSEAGGGTGNDIGLIRLANPILDIAPASLFAGDDTNLIGAEFITAGYGFPGIFGQPLGNFDGIRRGGRNLIESAGANFPQVTVEDQFFVTDFDRVNSSNPLDLEWQGSGLDSGSPWLVDVNGEYQIAGIVNGGLNSDTSTFGIRTALYNDWINTTIRANSIPEPGTMGLLALGLMGIVMRRRKGESHV